MVSQQSVRYALASTRWLRDTVTGYLMIAPGHRSTV
jgi:hypothetical protein